MSDLPYNKLKTFLLAFSKIFFDNENEVAAGITINEGKSAAVAKRGMSMAISDVLAMTSRMSVITMNNLNQKLKDVQSPTLTEIRAHHTPYVNKILKKECITSEDEYYVLRSMLDSEYLEKNEYRDRIQKKVDAYERI